ncbi:hypothetical protein B0T25DRAFT_630838 [Lasiosphaeria hispida]|uniref:Uncharacterized protein n=1 Tax=Lasiosphaeria hispida TaxID=260671 RepID=A0AAJ0HN13_9PEZI|nr:hypothetical protein B0T25DRAFT_630838 [Lasiosphaeria hispida]
MKFFTAALAAVAAGSAMAAPLNARDCITTPAPAPTPEVPGPSCDHPGPAPAPAPQAAYLPVPQRDVPAPAPVAHWAPSAHDEPAWSAPAAHDEPAWSAPAPAAPAAPPVPAVAPPAPAVPAPAPAVPEVPAWTPPATPNTQVAPAPVPEVPAQAAPAAPAPAAPSAPQAEPPKEAHVVEVCETVITIVVNVKVLIEADIALINKLLADAEIDVKALLAVIISLKLHLQILLTECMPKLQALVLSVLVEVDLQAILSLVLEIKGLFLEIEGCLKHLVVTVSAEVLAVIAVELHACLAIIGPIAGPIVQIALGAVAALKATVSVPALVAHITTIAGDITKCTSSFASILHPLLTLLL